YVLFADTAGIAQGGHACDRRRQIAEITRPRRRKGEAEEAISCLARHGGTKAQVMRSVLQLEIQVGLDVLGALSQTRQTKMPGIDSGKQVGAESPCSHFGLQIAVGTCKQMKVTLHFLIRP